jgi:hypothetical protein
LKKIPDQIAALVFQHACHHLYRRVDAGASKGVNGRPERAGFRLGRTIDDGSNACMQHGADTHQAGLESDAHHSVGKPVVADGPGSGAQGYNLGVRGGIGRTNRLVEPGGGNGAINNHNGANGHLAGGERATRFGERRSHEPIKQT